MTVFRRDFLKLASTGIAGAAAGISLGASIDTAAINRAIEAASARGGGTVRFPSGTYASYSIHLKSNVVLYLEVGATILAADVAPGGVTSGAGYDPAEPNKPWEDY